MHRCGVGGSGRAWLGLVAGLGIGLGLSILGLGLGLSFLARAQEGGVAVGGASGPLVSITLQKGEKVRGELLEFRDGKVRLRPEGGTAERMFLPSEVVELDFNPQEPVGAQVKPVGDTVAVPKVNPQPEPSAKTRAEPVPAPKNGAPEWPKHGTEAQSKDEPKRPPFEPFLKRRQIAEERRKKILDFIKQRADELLTPEERKRLHELMPREQNLTPGERKELDGLRQKLGLMDPDSFRRLTSDVMEEARQAQRKNELSVYAETHMKRLRSATTDEERRRHIASLFAAAQTTGRDTTPPLKDIAANLVRSTNANPNAFDDTMKELRALYDLFCDEVERLDTPQTLRSR